MFIEKYCEMISVVIDNLTTNCDQTLYIHIFGFVTTKKSKIDDEKANVERVVIFLFFDNKINSGNINIERYLKKKAIENIREAENILSL